MITVREGRSDPLAEPGRVTLNFEAKDIDKLYHRLKRQGVTFIMPMKSGRYHKEFAFVSPDGVRFHVMGRIKGKMPTTMPATRSAGDRPAAGKPAEKPAPQPADRPAPEPAPAPKADTPG